MQCCLGDPFPFCRRPPFSLSLMPTYSGMLPVMRRWGAGPGVQKLGGGRSYGWREICLPGRVLEPGGGRMSLWVPHPGGVALRCWSLGVSRTWGLFCFVLLFVFDLAWLPVASVTLGSLLTSYLEPQFYQVRWAGPADGGNGCGLGLERALALWCPEWR